MVIMNIHVILKHLQLVMNLLLVYHWYTTNGISHKLISLQKKKSIGGITSFVLDPGYLPDLTGMQRNLSPECLFMKKKSLSLL